MSRTDQNGINGVQRNRRVGVSVAGLGLFGWAVALGLTFAPEEGTTASKTFTETTRWTLEDLEQSVDGQTLGDPAPEMEGALERTVVVMDHYVKLAEGRPEELTRSFEELAAEFQAELSAGGAQASYGALLTSRLAESEATFVWDEEAEDFRVEWQTAPSGEEPEGVVEDMDLRAILPDGEVEEGDEWELDAEAVAGLFAPGGDLELAASSLAEMDVQFLQPEDVIAASFVSLAGLFLGEVSGEATAKWVSTEEGEGQSQAWIEIRFDVQCSRDLAVAYQAVVDKILEDTMRDDLSIEVSADLEGRARVAWDLERGHFVSYEAEVQGPIEAVYSWSMELPDGAHDFDARAELAAECTVQGSFEE